MLEALFETLFYVLHSKLVVKHKLLKLIISRDGFA